MSQSAVTSITPTLVLDKRIAFNGTGTVDFGVQKGAALNRWLVLPTSQASDNQITWTSSPPAPNVAFARNVLAQVTFRVTLTGTNVGADPTFFIANSGYACPRYMPLNQ
jgi:hypothetical protein